MAKTPKLKPLLVPLPADADVWLPPQKAFVQWLQTKGIPQTVPAMRTFTVAMIEAFATAAGLEMWFSKDTLPERPHALWRTWEGGYTFTVTHNGKRVALGHRLYVGPHALILDQLGPCIVPVSGFRLGDRIPVVEGIQIDIDPKNFNLTDIILRALYVMDFRGLTNSFQTWLSALTSAISAAKAAKRQATRATAAKSKRVRELEHALWCAQRDPSRVYLDVKLASVTWALVKAALAKSDLDARAREALLTTCWVASPNLTDLPKTVDPREVFFWANGEWVSAENDTVNPDNFYSVRPFNPYLDQGSLVNLAVAVPQLMKDYGVDNTWGQFSGQPWEYMPPEVRRELAVKLAVQVGGRPPGNALFWAGVAYGYASTHNSKRYPPVAKHPGVIFLPGKIAKTDKTPPNDPESRALRAAVEAAVGRPLDLTIRTGTGSGWRISLTDAVRHLL